MTTTVADDKLNPSSSIHPKYISGVIHTYTHTHIYIYIYIYIYIPFIKCLCYYIMAYINNTNLINNLWV